MVLASCGEDLSAKLLKQRDATGKYLYAEVKKPDPGTFKGDWTVFNVKTADTDVEKDYYENYYKTLCKKLKEGEGSLKDGQISDYGRVAIVLTAIGKDPTDVEGYNMFEKLDDMEQVINGDVRNPMHALIAAKYCGYTLKNEVAYAEHIKAAIEKRELFTDGEDEIEKISLALQSMTYYRYLPEVGVAIDMLISRLYELQKSDGGFGSCAKTAEALLGICSVGMDPITAAGLQKEGKNPFTNLLECVEGDGFKKDIKGKNIDIEATEKAMITLNAHHVFLKERMLFATPEERSEKN